MRPPDLRALLLSFFLLNCAICRAEDFRAGGAIGFGQGGASGSGITRVDGPIGLVGFIDYTLNPHLSLGVEHVSSAPLAAVGFTGFTANWYFWTPQPQVLSDPNDQITRPLLLEKNFSPYVGGAIGMGQAAFPARTTAESDVLVSSPYLSLKLGVEYPISGRWGARSEFNYGTTEGGSSIAEMIYLFVGAYYFF